MCCWSILLLSLRASVAASVSCLPPEPVDKHVGCWPLDAAPVRYNYTSYEPPAKQEAISHEVCSKSCSKITSLYALFNGDTCFCLPFIRLEETEGQFQVGCNTPCAGNSGEICGGHNTLSVYEVDCGEAPDECPYIQHNFDFSDYDADCEATTRRFRKIVPYLGQLQDLIVDPIGQSAALALGAVKGIGYYLDFPVQSGATLSVRMHLVSSGTDTTQPFHNETLTVYGIGGHETVKIQNISSYELGSNVAATKNDDIITFKSKDSIEPQLASMATLTATQKSHSVTIRLVEHTEVQIHFTSEGNTLSHFFLSGASHVQEPC